MKKLNCSTSEKGNWIGHVSRRNYFLKQVIEGKTEGRMEGTGRRGRGRKKLLDDVKETSRYWISKEEALLLPNHGSLRYVQVKQHHNNNNNNNNNNTTTTTTPPQQQQQQQHHNHNHNNNTITTTPPPP